ncbi:MAG: metallophosphoesterase, partial [Ruminococcus sp.]|nr:metallophosphoesterase [Ruminococcus sp.]
VVILDDTYIETSDYVLAGIGDASLDAYSATGAYGAYGAFDESKPVILLAHEPQYYELYQSLGADLVLAGHYHGGQIIIPGAGGLISPEFEFFPKPYQGVTDYSDMQLVLSRGLGNSVLPVRINDYPELVVVRVK